MMLIFTKIFQFIIKATNIFTLNKEQDIRIKIDRLADIIGEAVSYGYETALQDYAVWKDGEQIVGAGIYTYKKAQEKHAEEIQLIMKAIKGSDDA